MDDSSALVSCPSWALIPSTTSLNFFFSKLNITCKHKVFNFFLKQLEVFCWYKCNELTVCHFPSLYFSRLKIFCLPTESLILPFDMYKARWDCPPLVAAKNSMPSCDRVLTSREKCGLWRTKKKEERNIAFELVNSNKYTLHLLILHVRIYTYAWLCIRLFTYLGCRTCRGRL